MLAAVEQHKGPVYLRFGRAPVPDFSPEDLEFTIGEAQQLLDGDDVSIIATGHMVWEALQAAKILQSKGISARVINMHTIKPIDVEAIIKTARETGCMVTAEEHQVYDGLGSAVAEVLVQHHPVPLKMIGMQDRFGESGNPEELMDKYGLRSKDIAKAALNLFRES